MSTLTPEMLNQMIEQRWRRQSDDMMRRVLSGEPLTSTRAPPKTDPNAIDLVEVDGVWMTPEDASRVRSRRAPLLGVADGARAPRASAPGQLGD